MRRLVAAGLLPERAGQPVKALVHVSLADLIGLDGSSALMGQWTARVRAAWAAHRAAASVSGSDGGAWLDGDPARAFTCDASLTPVVTGDVNPAALDELVRLCAQLGRLHHHGTGTGPAPAAAATAAAMPRDGRGGRGAGPGRRPLPGRPGAGHHRQGRGPGLGSGRARRVPAPPAARRPAGRAEPAAGRRGQHGHPGRDPPRRHPARPALPVPRRLRPARRRLRGAPPDPQGRRRQDQRQPLRPVLHLPPPGRRSTSRAGPSCSTPTAPPPPGTRTKPRSCTATAPRPGPGDNPARQDTQHQMNTCLKSGATVPSGAVLSIGRDGRPR